MNKSVNEMSNEQRKRLNEKILELIKLLFN